MIICFSGTGNSQAVAGELSGCIGGDTVVVEKGLLLDPASCVIDVPSGEAVVWVMPVYSWGIPPVMERFIKKMKMKCAPSTEHFLVLTCGDDIGYADNQWRRLVGRRGWNPRGCFSVQMPNTYVLMKGFDVDSPEVSAAKLAAMPGRIKQIASAIGRGFAESDVVRGSWAWLKTAVIYPYFIRFCMSPRPFHASDACVSCGLCARSCPMENIAMADGRPLWSNRCALCLRCYHICPARAVAYGSATATKGQKEVLK